MSILFVWCIKWRNWKLMQVSFFLINRSSLSIDYRGFLVVDRITLYTIILLKSRSRIIKWTNKFIRFSVIPINNSHLSICKHKEVLLNRLKKIVPYLIKRDKSKVLSTFSLTNINDPIMCMITVCFIQQKSFLFSYRIKISRLLYSCPARLRRFNVAGIRCQRWMKEGRASHSNSLLDCLGREERIDSFIIEFISTKWLLSNGIYAIT